uniref:Putative secreted protein n=1 Tax=Psorophora albipes TaxID=869069 RepID=T1D5D3_9DIPT
MLGVTFLPRWASLAGAEPSDAVGSALAAIAVLHLNLIWHAHLPIGVHSFLLLVGTLTSGLRRLGLGLRVVTLHLRDAELSRAGFQRTVRRAAACVAVLLEDASRFTFLVRAQGQCSSEEHRRN